MSNLLDLSGKIDPASLALYETLSEVAGSLGVPFFVVGATARDMIFESGHGLPSRRATKDKDFGVRVASWGEFEKLKESLLSSGQFKQTKEVQRLRYRGELLVDILPFGEIADAKGEIRWPPDEDVVMSIVGFEDAYRAAREVRVRASPPLEILAASTPGLTIMKLVSWADRPEDRSRDAVDLAHILERYLDADNNYDRLLEAHMDLVEVENFDYVRAGARLLGRDIASIGKPETIVRIKEILAKETADQGQYRLIQAMIAGRGAPLEEREDAFGELLAVLLQLVKGIEDR
jgi:predicted nucleotidyltransferase